MGKRGSKIGVVILIIMLAVGFATVTTSLLINGTTGISTNPEDFNVFFSYATTSAGSTAVIEEGKKAITFTGKTLMSKGDKATLNYTVKNDSSQYDANISLSINVTDSSGVDHSSYYKITKQGFTDAEPTLLSAKSAKDGSITIELVKAYADEEFTLSFEVTLDVEAVERDTTGTYDTISGTAYDINGNVLANTPLVMFSEPTYFTTDDEGHYELSLPNGIHNAYYLPGATIEDLQDMGEKIKTNMDAAVVLVDTHVSTDLIFGFRQIGDIVTIGGEDFHFLGFTNDGYYKLLAQYPINIQTMKQVEKNYSTIDLCENNWYYCENYNNSQLKPYVDQYVTSLYDSRYDFDHGRLLTVEEFDSLSGIGYDNSRDYYEDKLYLDNGNYSNMSWLINSSYWLYDTINVTSYINRAWWYDYDIRKELGIEEFGDETVTRAYQIYYEYNDRTKQSRTAFACNGYFYSVGIRPVVFVKAKQN